MVENTPPPSPGGTGRYRVDTEGINDDVVVGVIEQLEKTGNRPHSAKELAAVLTNTLGVVERYVPLCPFLRFRQLASPSLTLPFTSSANPAAMISSRLTSYVRRKWSALAPCPITKELTDVHPRRTYFYLATCPHQPIPEVAQVPSTANRIISPSLSSAADEGEDEGDERDARSRASLSPSPEIDLTSPDLLGAATANGSVAHGASFSGHGPLMGESDGTATTADGASHNRRAVSPPLEREEREFTQTACSMQQRSRSLDLGPPVSTDVQMTTDDDGHDRDAIATADADAAEADASERRRMEETEESAAMRNREVAAELFGAATEHDSPISRPPGIDVRIPTTRPYGGHARRSEATLRCRRDGRRQDGRRQGSRRQLEVGRSEESRECGAR